MSDYTKAKELIEEYIQNESLKKHCYAVEDAMRFYAKKIGEDEDRWACAGLLHDVDWEKMPETHPNTAAPILQEAGYDQELINAVLSHGYPTHSSTPRESILDHHLFACDEITGFITAYSYMKGGLDGVEVSSIIKKLKDKAFARNVSRDDIRMGADAIGLALEEHVGNVLSAMKEDQRLK
jgi:putative nucleotidyltransferase with HDIG domain